MMAVPYDAPPNQTSPGRPGIFQEVLGEGRLGQDPVLPREDLLPLCFAPGAQPPWREVLADPSAPQRVGSLPPTGGPALFGLCPENFSRGAPQGRSRSSTSESPERRALPVGPVAVLVLESRILDPLRHVALEKAPEETRRAGRSSSSACTTARLGAVADRTARSRPSRWRGTMSEVPPREAGARFRGVPPKGLRGTCAPSPRPRSPRAPGSARGPGGEGRLRSRRPYARSFAKVVRGGPPLDDELRQGLSRNERGTPFVQVAKEGQDLALAKRQEGSRPRAQKGEAGIARNHGNVFLPPVGAWGKGERRGFQSCHPFLAPGCARRRPSSEEHRLVILPREVPGRPAESLSAQRTPTSPWKSRLHPVNFHKEDLFSAGRGGKPPSPFFVRAGSVTGTTKSSLWVGERSGPPGVEPATGRLDSGEGRVSPGRGLVLPLVRPLGARSDKDTLFLGPEHTSARGKTRAKRLPKSLRDPPGSDPSTPRRLFLRNTPRGRRLGKVVAAPSVMNAAPISRLDRDIFLFFSRG